MRDIASTIASVIIETGRMPDGPGSTIRWALRTWPHATHEQASRAYDIAMEIFEDDYLFEMA